MDDNYDIAKQKVGKNISYRAALEQQYPNPPANAPVGSPVPLPTVPPTSHSPPDGAAPVPLIAAKPLPPEAQNCLNLVGISIPFLSFLFFFSLWTLDLTYYCLDNKYVAEMLDILEPDDSSVWKVGLARDGLVSWYRKAKDYSPYVYKAETTINCGANDLFTLVADPSVRSKVLTFL
jgi:hypothetical protein